MGTSWMEVPAWVTRKGVRSMHTLAVADPPAGSPLRTPRDRRRAFDSQTGAPFGERALSKSHCGDEQGWQALAPVTGATGEIPEQYRRARPSERKTAASTWPGLRCLLDGPTKMWRSRGSLQATDLTAYLGREQTTELPVVELSSRMIRIKATGAEAARWRCGRGDFAMQPSPSV